MLDGLIGTQVKMSLFPAYSQNSAEEKETAGTSVEEESDGNVRPAWLHIESFPINLTDIPLPSEHTHINKEDEDVIIVHVATPSTPQVRNKEDKGRASDSTKKKAKKNDHKRKKQDTDFPEKEIFEGDFYEDKTAVRGYLTVKTLTRPLVPIYHVGHHWLTNTPFKVFKKHNRKRYYHQNLDLLKPETVVKNVKADSHEKIESTMEGSWQVDVESQLSKKTAEFNKMLTEHPENVDVWLEYVKFQDVLQKFEQNHRRGSNAKSLRVMTDRKVCILDKALLENPNCDKLLKERFRHAERLYPADTLSLQLGQMVERSPNSVVIWRSYIRTTQGSLSLCNTTAVMKLYDQGMKKLHQLRRGAPSSNTLPMETGILDLLLDSGLFLRQAGLWEQLWTLLRIYLELNLAQPDTDLFKNFVVKSEDYITGLEETVLNSQLPLPELWYRIERLREAVHWLPWTSDDECEDPQRLVFVDDVSDMLHPITTAGLNYRLALIALSILKIPSLPSRHTTFQFIGLDLIPYSLDCVEALLAIFFPQSLIHLEDKTFLQGALNLVYGPQYLTSSWPGQEQYLDFVTKVLNSCAVCLNEPERTAIFIWWLRFERHLIILDKLEHCKLPQQRKKKIKSTVKEFLKLEENRNNSLYFVEYALFEYEMGQRDNAYKILNTAIVAQGAVPVISVGCEYKKAELCKLYRTLCEFLIGFDYDLQETSQEIEPTNKQKAINVLVSLGLGMTLGKAENSVPAQQIENAIKKFCHISTELLVTINDQPSHGTEHLLPDFVVDWITCYAWLLLLTQSVWEAGKVYEECLQKIPPAKDPNSMPVLVSTCQREGIFENYVSMLYHYCKKNAGVYSVLQEVLQRSLQEFPNNLHLLAVIANVETTVSCVGTSWWELTKYFRETNSLLPQVFQVFFLRYQGSLLQKATQQNHDFMNSAGPVIPDPSIKNRLSAFYNRLLNDDEMKRCPMIWRLYLRFLAEHGKETSYHSAFYRAVEECPWVKVLFVEAVKLLPAELPQLQDLLIEKELRIHVTPEELDILRRNPEEAV